MDLLQYLENNISDNNTIDEIIDSAKTYNVNPYYIIARLINLKQHKFE